MPFQPGNKHSVGKGRPKGSKNKRGTLQEAIKQFIHGNLEDLQHEYDHSISFATTARLIAELLPYAIPKLQATAIQTQYDKLDDESLEALVETLKDKVITDNQPLKAVK